MTHYTTPDYWNQYNTLPTFIKTLADKNFDLLKKNSKHPSLQLKSIKQ